MSFNWIALEVIEDWLDREYANDEERLTGLHVLIIAALKDQDKLTRHLAADQVAAITANATHDNRALKVLIDWGSREDTTPMQQIPSLQALIEAALKEQNN
jgi:hypothetical protein